MINNVIIGVTSGHLAFNCAYQHLGMNIQYVQQCYQLHVYVTHWSTS